MYKRQTIPSPVYANDGYYNTVSGTLSTEWQAATGLGAISVEPSDLVVFNGTNWTYVPAAPSAVASVFGRLGAVVATEGDYDLDQLGDVDLTSTPPANNDYLKYDGSAWVPSAVTAGVTSVFGRSGAVVATEGDYDLDELGDVDLTTTAPVTDDVLKYDGTNWVPGEAGAVPAGVTGSVQINDGAGALGFVTDFIWDSANTELDVPGDINLDDGGTYSTTIQSITATADRFISFPDATGVVALVQGLNGAVQFNNAGVSGGGNLGYNTTTGTFGYTFGRGTETQATNKSTAVTLNAPSGAITMNAAALAADTTVSFTLTNSSIEATDLLVLNHVSGGTAGSYLLNAQAAAGSASINVRNITGGSLSEAIVIGFAVIKA